jgi:UDP-3-O-acyl-N-acetylglucosamine deacetylase
MINELGLGSGGRLDNFILVGEEEVVNTALRFPDEFVRHKILDIIGDLYLLGYPIRGRVTARLTGHRDNIAIQRMILAAASPSAASPK